MAQPSREEIIAFITEEAQKRGIGVQEALAIAQGESGLDPAAQGDYRGGVPQSGGLFQMFNQGGMGNDFTTATGLSSMDPESWKEQVIFALDQAAKPQDQGGRGWGPWNARHRDDVNVGQYQGIPGQQPSQPGRRDRASEVAQSPTPMFPFMKGQQEKADGFANLFGMTPEEFQDTYNPKGAHTLAGKVTDWVGLTDPEQRASERPDTLLSAAFQKAGLTGPAKKKAKLEDKLAEVNPLAPQSEEEQLKKKLTKKPVTLASMFMSQPAPEKATTLGGAAIKGIGSLLGFG